jgi:hypothetical protein
MTRGYGFVQRAIVALLTRDVRADEKTLTRHAYNVSEPTKFQIIAVQAAIRQLAKKGIIKLAPIHYWKSARQPCWRLVDIDAQARKDENKRLKKSTIKLASS